MTVAHHARMRTCGTRHMGIPHRGWAASYYFTLRVLNVFPRAFLLLLYVFVFHPFLWPGNFSLKSYIIFALSFFVMAAGVAVVWAAPTTLQPKGELFVRAPKTTQTTGQGSRPEAEAEAEGEQGGPD